MCPELWSSGRPDDHLASRRRCVLDEDGAAKRKRPPGDVRGPVERLLDALEAREELADLVQVPPDADGPARGSAVVAAGPRPCSGPLRVALLPAEAHLRALARFLRGGLRWPRRGDGPPTRSAPLRDVRACVPRSWALPRVFTTVRVGARPTSDLRVAEHEEVVGDGRERPLGHALGRVQGGRFEGEEAGDPEGLEADDQLVEQVPELVDAMCSVSICVAASSTTREALRAPADGPRGRSGTDRLGCSPARRRESRPAPGRPPPAAADPSASALASSCSGPSSSVT